MCTTDDMGDSLDRGHREHFMVSHESNGTDGLQHSGRRFLSVGEAGLHAIGGRAGEGPLGDSAGLMSFRVSLPKAGGEKSLTTRRRSSGADFDGAKREGFLAAPACRQAGSE